ncbi:MAG: hypothetical protein Q7T86_16555 [Hyphomicrobiaceae bacterium]|nr:hypothetical protein [Hyphomicrobiaceae bacterium]
MKTRDWLHLGGYIPKINERSACSYRVPSDPSKPVVAAIFPKAAFSHSDIGEAVGKFDRMYVISVRALTGQCARARRTVRERQGSIVETIRQYRLRMPRVDRIAAIERVSLPPL